METDRSKRISARIAVVDELATLSESLSAMSKMMACVASSACGAEGPDPEEACLLTGIFLAHAAGDLSRIADDVDRLRMGESGDIRYSRADERVSAVHKAERS